MERVLEISGGDGGTLGMYLMPLNCKNGLSGKFHVYITIVKKTGEEEKMINLFCKFIDVPVLCPFKHFAGRIHSGHIGQYFSAGFCLLSGQIRQ